MKRSNTVPDSDHSELPPVAVLYCTVQNSADLLSGRRYENEYCTAVLVRVYACTDTVYSTVSQYPSTVLYDFGFHRGSSMEQRVNPTDGCFRDSALGFHD